MPEGANAERYRCHVLSIRENPADECLIKEMWGRDAEIDIMTNSQRDGSADVSPNSGPKIAKPHRACDRISDQPNDSF